MSETDADRVVMHIASWNTARVTVDGGTRVVASIEQGFQGGGIGAESLGEDPYLAAALERLPVVGADSTYVEQVVRNLATAPWPYSLEDAEAYLAAPRDPFGVSQRDAGRREPFAHAAQEHGVRVAGARRAAQGEVGHAGQRARRQDEQQQTRRQLLGRIAIRALAARRWASSSVTGRRPRRKSKSTPSSACSTWSRNMRR